MKLQRLQHFVNKRTKLEFHGEEKAATYRGREWPSKVKSQNQKSIFKVKSQNQKSKCEFTN